MKNTKIGLLLMLIILSSISFCRATDETNEYEDDGEDDYDFDEYSDYDNSTASPRDDYLNEKQPTNMFTNTTNISTMTTTPTTTVKPTVILPTLVIENEVPVCPDQCICTDGTQFVDCSNLGLSQMPKLPSNAIKINLSQNSIATLHHKDFPNKMQTRHLTLADNQINSIDAEIFAHFPQLDTLNFSGNSLTQLSVNTFKEAVDLAQLILDYNPIELELDETFLNQPELSELSLKGCNLTTIPDTTFSNLTGLTALNLAENDFHESINTKAFEPLTNLGKLSIPSITHENVYELCRILTAIDVITTARYDVSCFELVSGDKFEESTMTIAPKQNVENETSIEEAIVTNVTTTTKTTQSQLSTTAINTTTATSFISTTATTAKNIIENAEFSNKTEATFVETKLDAEHSSGNTVNISSDAVKNILIGIIITATAGLGIGLLFRSDVFGIKTKLCRTSKRRPSPTDQVSPAEEVPLNKV